MEIRTILSAFELEACVELQRRVWRFGRRDLVSSGMLEASREAGGILLGAFEKGNLIGFVFSLPAPRQGRVIQHSHMLGVLRGHRNKGIGYQLKLEQYRRAAQLGNPWVTWTFEPLESKNAHLNLNRLGATARRYFVDLYGETSSELHAGLGTDRLLAEWEVLPNGTPPSQNQRDKSAAGRLPKAILSRPRRNWREPIRTRTDLDSPLLTVEIPTRIQELKKEEPALAAAWRRATREAFLHYLPRGYLVDALLVQKTDRKIRRSFYRLRQTPPTD